MKQTGKLVAPIAWINTFVALVGLVFTFMGGGWASEGSGGDWFFEVQGLYLGIFTTTLIGGLLLIWKSKIGFWIVTVLYSALPMLFLKITGVGVITYFEGLVSFAIFSVCSLGIAFYLFKNNPYR